MKIMNKLVGYNLVVVMAVAAIPAVTSLTLAQESDYKLFVRVGSHNFGDQSVIISIQTANGYHDSRNVATAGGASAVFNVPPGQGGEVNVCVSGPWLFEGTNCQKFIVAPDQTQESVTINAG